MQYEVPFDQQQQNSPKKKKKSKHKSKTILGALEEKTQKSNNIKTKQ